jgi:hypothetical protein
MEENTNLAACILEEYHQFLSLFTEPMAKALPPHRSFNHTIDRKGDEQLPWGPIYALLETELKAFREYLTRKIQY